MEEHKENSVENDLSGKATAERGKKAIKADEEINKKDVADSRKKEESAKEAEKWHNEG